MKKQKICIIGGNLTGLVTAISLSKLNCDIDLITSDINKNTKSNRTIAISENNFNFLNKLNIAKSFTKKTWPCSIMKLYTEGKNEKFSEIFEFNNDGSLTRSFMHVDDCVEGIHRLMLSSYSEPLNLGTDRMVSVNELVDIVANAASKTIYKRHDLTKPQGVRGRNSDNTKLAEFLSWTPKINLEDGLVGVYQWIKSQVESKA